MKVKVSPRFEKNYKKLPKEVKERAKQRELIFRENPFDSRLKTHKLSGRDKECWAFSVDYSYRIKFIFLNDEEILFLDIGTHEIYR
jgi:mRNA-degrading endonuclease YafQ of YafQ-DinJ toxin-antitoxin module